MSGETQKVLCAGAGVGVPTPTLGCCCKGVGVNEGKLIEVPLGLSAGDGGGDCAFARVAGAGYDVGINDSTRVYLRIDATDLRLGFNGPPVLVQSIRPRPCLDATLLRVARGYQVIEFVQVSHGREAGQDVFKIMEGIKAEALAGDFE